MGSSKRIRRQRVSANGGFTLMELVVVLAIISILSTIIVPSLTQRLAKERLENTVYQLHSDLRLAQETAQREQYPVVLSIYQKSKTQNMYVIRVQNSENIKEQTVIKSVDMPVHIKVEYTGDTSVIFREDGHIMFNGHLTIYRGQERKYIYFYQTGRVRISDRKI